MIVGGAITKAADATAAARAIKQAMRTGVAGQSSMGARGSSDDDVRKILLEVSTPNISDAAHRCPIWSGWQVTQPAARMAGRAVTVRTVPGDWAKPVEAIDRCQPGDVLVIDAGWIPPAVWGELATNSAVNRGLAGVVVHGAIRDTSDIRRLGIPVFARHVCAQAGEPKGVGEIGGPLRIDGVECRMGDWVVGDADGVVVIPHAKAVETANRAMYCLEAENRLRSEIVGGKSTLAKVMDLEKWEKKVLAGESDGMERLPESASPPPRPAASAKPPVHSKPVAPKAKRR